MYLTKEKLEHKAEALKRYNNKLGTKKILRSAFKKTIMLNRARSSTSMVVQIKAAVRALTRSLVATATVGQTTAVTLIVFSRLTKTCEDEIEM